MENMYYMTLWYFECYIEGKNIQIIISNNFLIILAKIILSIRCLFTPKYFHTCKVLHISQKAKINEMYVRPSISLSFRLSVRPSARLSVHLTTYQSIHPSVRLSDRLSVRPSARLSIRLSVHLSIYQSIHPSVR